MNKNREVLVDFCFFASIMPRLKVLFYCRQRNSRHRQLKFLHCFVKKILVATLCDSYERQ